MTILALIIQVKLGLLLSKNSKKRPHTTPISKNSDERVFKHVTP